MDRATSRILRPSGHDHVLSEDAHLRTVGEFARRLLLLCRYRRDIRNIRSVPTVDAVVLSGVNVPPVVLAVVRAYWDIHMIHEARLHQQREAPC